MMTRVCALLGVFGMMYLTACAQPLTILISFDGNLPMFRIEAREVFRSKALPFDSLEVKKGEFGDPAGAQCFMAWQRREVDTWTYDTSAGRCPPFQRGEIYTVSASGLGHRGWRQFRVMRDGRIWVGPQRQM